MKMSLIWWKLKEKIRKHSREEEKKGAEATKIDWFHTGPNYIYHWDVKECMFSDPFSFWMWIVCNEKSFSPSLTNYAQSMIEKWVERTYILLRLTDTYYKIMYVEKIGTLWLWWSLRYTLYENGKKILSWYMKM